MNVHVPKPAQKDSPESFAFLCNLSDFLASSLELCGNQGLGEKDDKARCYRVFD